MQVQLNEIGPEGKEVRYPLTPAWLSAVLAGGDRAFPFAPAGEALAEVRLRRIGLDVVVEGDFKVRLEADCSSCLQDFTLDLPVVFSLALLPASARPQNQPVQQELTGAELEEAYYHGEAIELEDILREQILLALPMVPRCSEGCRGLCPVCGVDRNREPCSCASGDDVDPRWAGLVAVKASTSRGEGSP